MDKELQTKADIGCKAYSDKKRWKNYNLNQLGEVDLFGMVDKPNKKQAYAYMALRMPSLRRFVLNRSVAERIDLNSDAKVVFSVLSSFPVSPRLYITEIAGLCGLSIRKVGAALYDLEQYGLIRIKRNYYTKNRSAASTYIILPYAERFRKDAVPRMFRNTLQNLEKKVNARFKL